MHICEFCFQQVQHHFLICFQKLYIYLCIFNKLLKSIYLYYGTYYNALLIRQSRHDFTDLWSRAGPCPNETGGVLILGAGTHSQGVKGHFGGLLLGDDLEPLSQPLRDQLPEQLCHREGLSPVELIILLSWRTTIGHQISFSNRKKTL